MYVNDVTSAKVHKRLARAYLFQNGFVALVAFLFLVTAISFWLDPNGLGRVLTHTNAAPYDYYWNGFYTVGSVLILIGLFSRRVGLEIVGHTLLVPGLLLAFGLSAAHLGFHANTLLTLVFATGAGLRAYGLVVGWQVDVT